MANGKPGRPKGLPKTGGRVKGGTLPPGRTLPDQALKDASGLTEEQIEALQPYDVMRMVMLRGVRSWDMRMAFMAAKELAPYVHPKLTTTTVQGNADKPLAVEQTVKSVDERKPVETFLAEWAARDEERAREH
jgi:hypothetical protein